MQWLLLFSTVVIANCKSIEKKTKDWDSLIDKINSADSTWKAEKYHDFKDYTHESVKSFLGAKLDEKYNAPLKTLDDFQDLTDIPEEFDSRKNWPQCSSIGQIRDQANCGSCWAVAAAETLTDRFCIASGGKITTSLSQEDLLSCCNDCGYGCDGGYLGKAWNYMRTEGIVSGGDYDSHIGCKPYSVMPCAKPNAISGKKCRDLPTNETPICSMKCTNSRHFKSFKNEHHKVTKYYYLNETAAIQKEILQNGPVEAAFVVYEDFMFYKSGVYRYLFGNIVGGHAIKIIGWGMENKTPYWLMANSWKPSWGENGFFRMVRGQDECNIESRSVVAGLPDLKNMT